MKQHLCLAALAVATICVGALPAAARGDDLPLIVANDNRRPAGIIVDDALVLSLRASLGRWHPEGDQGAELTVESFGEASGPLQVPAPLIRVREGMTVAATVRNDLDLLLRVHGLCSRDGSPCAPFDVPPGEQRDVRFIAGTPGTYHYWATTTGMPLAFRGGPDASLSGAFVVDPRDAGADLDRVLVISEWTSITRAQLRDLVAAEDAGVLFRKMNPRFTFLVNGLAWPATERLTYGLDEHVRWRVLNLSTQAHPMHLHGFYFDVTALGDGLRDTALAEADRPRVVTQLLPPGGTMAMTWRAERPGNWLLHCHISEHIAPERRLSNAPAHDNHHAGHDAMGGMASMVVGITVLKPGDATDLGREAAVSPARMIRMVMQTEADRYGREPAYGFVLADGGAAPAADKVTVPGPTLALTRGEPVEITLVNHLPEATAIHWHGMELESYYDGVHGWSGAGTQVTPLIEPGQSFSVRFTPPRAGTFIYHTHMHDERQLSSGMYGALLVLEPGEAFDPDTDHVLVIGRAGLGRTALTVLNGDRQPQFSWKAGVRHRLRLINITPDDIFGASLETTAGTVSWRPITKDGAPVPASQRLARPATQTIAVGETYDFEYEAPAGRQTVWLNVKSTGGRWQVQGLVIIR